MKRNIWYAMYDKEDNYIIGFNSLSEMSEFLGNSKPALTRTLIRHSESRGEINRTYYGNNTIDCSQKVYTYKNSVFSKDGDCLGEGCSLFKFWEETN